MSTSNQCRPYVILHENRRQCRFYASSRLWSCWNSVPTVRRRWLFFCCLENATNHERTWWPQKHCLFGVSSHYLCRNLLRFDVDKGNQKVWFFNKSCIIRICKEMFRGWFLFFMYISFISVLKEKKNMNTFAGSSRDLRPLCSFFYFFSFFDMI